MSISVNQIDGALQTIQSLNSTLNDMRMLLNQAKELAAKSWQVDIGSRVPLVVTISPAQQAAMIAQYDTFKTSLATAFQQLP